MSVATDEQQPLLPPAALVSDAEIRDREHSRGHEPTDEENGLPADSETDVVVETKKERSWWTITWYTTLIVLGVFLVAMFIKGFIDADDVEVCIRPYHPKNGHSLSTSLTCGKP